MIKYGDTEEQIISRLNDEVKEQLDEVSNLADEEGLYLVLKFGWKVFVHTKETDDEIYSKKLEYLNDVYSDEFKKFLTKINE